MSKETDKFIEYLRGKINSYRLEMLTDFYEDPQLLLGDGLRSFDILSLLQPVVLFGPTGYPLPAGSFFDSTDKVPRFVAREMVHRDTLVSLDTRIRSQRDCRYDGAEIIPEPGAGSQNEGWHATDQDLTLVAGSYGPQSFIGGTGGTIIECDLWDIMVKPVDDAAPIQLTLFFSASTGNVVGMPDDIPLTYTYDATGGVYELSAMKQTFQNAKRLATDTAGASLQIQITGGAGAEHIYLVYNWRKL